MSTDPRNPDNAAPDRAALPSVVTDGLPSTRNMIDDVFGSSAGRVIHNFGDNKLQAWKLTALATGPDCHKPLEFVGKQINITWFYAHEIQMEDDKTGEVITATRVVLIDKAMTAVAFVSKGIAKDLVPIIQLFGIKPYDPPVPVTLRQFQVGGRNMMYSLQPI